ncbi:hypothetical protein [Frigoriflavimonas asaccharolytica]|uniref:Lipoprotein n=1 Tax=Frigoriflavimonas asaccharolytica TaxID=2735899 RepID=A0A8J8K7T8_9FLAO|nr:hypothetical protein [Frigoriflavimonas asaccharolytica]NRS91831.1 hypothetical protein [Frigoriflavimonas asaccharolytica]
MKKILLLLTLIIFTSCISRNNEKYVLNESTVILRAKFFKIETKNGIHIYHFKNDAIEGVFVKASDSILTNSNFRKIKLNKKYTLVLNKQLSYASCFGTETEEVSYTENNVLVWQTGMKSSYFVDCENIIGKKINPRFTLIKYIDPKEPKNTK